MKHSEVQLQLSNEIKDICVGLAMVNLAMIESKRIDIDSEDTSQAKSSDEQWKKITSLYRALLYNHRDVMLAFYAQSNSPTPFSLSQTYISLIFTWHNSVHPFLEQQRCQLPESQFRMVAYAYLGHSMDSILYEASLALKSISTERLCDTSIEDDSQDLQDTGASISRKCYTQSPCCPPTTSSLNHHLPVLTQMDIDDMLYCDAKSSCLYVFFTHPRKATRPPLYNLSDRHKLPNDTLHSSHVAPGTDPGSCFLQERMQLEEVCRGLVAASKILSLFQGGVVFLSDRIYCYFSRCMPFERGWPIEIGTSLARLWPGVECTEHSPSWWQTLAKVLCIAYDHVRRGFRRRWHGKWN